MSLFYKFPGMKPRLDTKQFSELEKNGSIESRIAYLLGHDESFEAKEKLVDTAIKYTHDIRNVVARIQEWHLKDKELDKLNAIMDRYASKASGIFANVWLNNISQIRPALNKK